MKAITRAALISISLLPLVIAFVSHEVSGANQIIGYLVMGGIIWLSITRFRTHKILCSLTLLFFIWIYVADFLDAPARNEYNRTHPRWYDEDMIDGVISRMLPN